SRACCARAGRTAARPGAILRRGRVGWTQGKRIFVFGRRGILRSRHDHLPLAFGAMHDGAGFAAGDAHELIAVCATKTDRHGHTSGQRQRSLYFPSNGHAIQRVVRLNHRSARGSPAVTRRAWSSLLTASGLDWEMQPLNRTPPSTKIRVAEPRFRLAAQEVQDHAFSVYAALLD